MGHLQETFSLSSQVVTEKKTFAPSKDSDQPGHPPSLKLIWVLICPLGHIEGADQTVHIPRLIWIFVERKWQLCEFCHAPAKMVFPSFPAFEGYIDEENRERRDPEDFWPWRGFDYRYYQNPMPVYRPRPIPRPINTWACAWQNQQSDMGAQRRLRSAWASAQSHQSLRCPHEKTLGL